MKLVNRGFISVRPKKHFFEWAATQDIDLEFLPAEAEPSIYLIEEDFWDETLLLKAYHHQICTREFSEITDDERCWPANWSQQELDFYFEIRCGGLVFDLLKSALESEEL
ncbi:MAG: hypothetical protein RLZZ301_1363 [Bacteroidota bacterium]|jgi:hypothetical protein